jgi:Protein of unknown function (DUF3489)
MTTFTTEETDTAQTTATGAQPKPGKKVRAGARRAHVAPKKAKSGKKASPPKKAHKAAPKAASKPKAARLKAATEKGVREGSKTETILSLMKRSGGATLKEIMEATSWQPHSVRGFISGTLGKKMGLTVISAKGEDGARTYSIKS